MAGDTELSPAVIEQIALCEGARETVASKPPRARTTRVKEPTETEVAKLKAWGWTPHRKKGHWTDPQSPTWSRRWDAALNIIAKGEARGDLPGDVAPPEAPQAAPEALDAISPIPAPPDAYTAADGAIFGAVSVVATARAAEPLDTFAAAQAEPAVDASDYERFIAAKQIAAPERGFDLPLPISEMLFPFQGDIVRWACKRGHAAIFASFGLGKTFQQLEIGRQVLAHAGGRFLIIAPLGVRAEFVRDAAKLGLSLAFIQSSAQVGDEGLFITNYESVRDGKVDVTLFTGVTCDEASCLRGGGKTLTFREFMRVFEGDRVRYLFVATATPSPNDYIELLLYAAFLGVMDISQSKTRFFKRDSVKADALTIHPHKVREFWLWVASWSLFVTRPSDLGYPDDGYALPELRVHWHELPSDHAGAGAEKSGQIRLLNDTAAGIVEASREKRASLTRRVDKALEIVRTLRAEGAPVGAPGPHADSGLTDQIVVWCDLNDEQVALGEAFEREGMSVSSMFGAQDIDTREELIERWRARQTSIFLSKPVMYGAGVNLQQSHTMLYAGIGFKFQEFIQGIHREYRFLQAFAVDAHILYTEAERSVREALEAKWRQHNELVAEMTAIVREYGLTRCALHEELSRAVRVERREVRTERCVLVNNDCVREARGMAENSVDLIVTSIPFSTQYEYSPSLYDFGHTDDNGHFWAQMDHLSPALLRVLKPGRVAAVHVKDRIVPGGLTGLGFQTLYPFHCDAIAHYQRHGFALLGIVTIVTDVVRENNQTYRLAYTEQCKDGSRQGVGVPEYLLLFRKPQTDRTKGYADEPVVKRKEDYKLSRWQIDAAGFWRSGGDRLLTAEDLAGLTHAQIFKLFRRHHLAEVYDHEHHVALNAALEARGSLPVDFSLLQPQSWSEHVWTDVTRMQTLNGSQAAKGREQHLCPMQFDVADRVIRRFSMPGETVLDPFGGLMTVPYRAVKLGRRGYGIELSAKYFADGVNYVRAIEREAAVPTLFDLDAAERDESPVGDLELPAASGG